MLLVARHGSLELEGWLCAFVRWNTSYARTIV